VAEDTRSITLLVTVNLLKHLFADLSETSVTV